mmetsp:Transcript_64424/g.122125  ORF Transcript_64424/g.122125 Transcript_64424/m.122125 type:complete len:224 (-) Transcript_64424:475-1146(-)
MVQSIWIVSAGFPHGMEICLHLPQVFHPEQRRLENHENEVRHPENVQQASMSAWFLAEYHVPYPLHNRRWKQHNKERREPSKTEVLKNAPSLQASIRRTAKPFEVSIKLGPLPLQHALQGVAVGFGHRKTFSAKLLQTIMFHEASENSKHFLLFVGTSNDYQHGSDEAHLRNVADAATARVCQQHPLQAHFFLWLFQQVNTTNILDDLLSPLKVRGSSIFANL